MSATQSLLARADQFLAALMARLPPPLNTPRVRFRLQAGAAIALIVSFFVLLLLFFDVLAPLNRLATDFLYRPVPPQPPIALIAIDKQSLDAIGTFPWSRSLHAEILDQLAAAPPRVVAFDVVFAPLSPDDPQFAETIQRAGNVILATSAEDGTALPLQSDTLPAFTQLLLPEESLRSAALAVGHRILNPDPDGITRRIATGVSAHDVQYPALGLVAAARFLNQPLNYDLPNQVVTVGSVRIPTDEYGNALLNFTNPHADIDTYSFIDVLRGNVPPERFADRLVFVGGNSTIESAEYSIPLQLGEAHTYNVNLQVDLANMLLAQPALTLRTQGPLGQVALILAMALLAGLTLPHLRLLYAVILTLIYLIGLLLFAFDAFTRGLLIQILYPALALVLTAACIVTFRYFSEDRRRQFLTLLFRRYVPAESVGQVIDAVDSGALPLTGTRRFVTVLYADMRGFATMSDEMTAEVVLQTVNRYMELALQAISAQGGTVSKPMGDALIAIWNAPLDQSDHRARGLLAAINIRRNFADYQKKSDEQEKLTLGIGLATGYAVLGNISALGKVEYTLVGDTVNVAARISAFANNNQILADTTTASEPPSDIVVRELSPVRVRGRKEPLPVWEVREANPSITNGDEQQD